MASGERQTKAIVMFMHCRKCVRSKPAQYSANSWSNLEVGLTPAGHLQVWCRRHNEHVYTSPHPVETPQPVCEACETGMPHTH
jgi:hypothetical protein